MEYFLTDRYNWVHFLTFVAILLGVYFLLKLLIRIGLNIRLVGKAQSYILGILQTLLLVFEPVAIVILLGVFVLISPQLHGILVAFVLLGSVSILRSYVNGRIILFDKEIGVGSALQTSNNAGTVTEMGRLGLKVRSKTGKHFINYSSLIKDGYALSTNENVGGNYQLSLEDIREEDGHAMNEELHLILSTSPYLEAEDQLKIEEVTSNPKKASVSLTIRNKKHLQDLIALLYARGYKADIINT